MRIRKNRLIESCAFQVARELACVARPAKNTHQADVVIAEKTGETLAKIVALVKEKLKG